MAERARAAVEPVLPRVGARVLFLKGHPWGGHTGTVEKHEKFFLDGSPCARVMLDNGVAAGCFPGDAKEVAGV